MRWIQYPDDEARRELRDGRNREGRAWAAPGPIPGTIWVIPSDEADRLYLVVHVYPNAPEANYALDTEQIGRTELGGDELELPARAAVELARFAPLAEIPGVELGVTVTAGSHEARP